MANVENGSKLAVDRLEDMMEKVLLRFRPSQILDELQKQYPEELTSWAIGLVESRGYIKDSLVSSLEPELQAKEISLSATEKITTGVVQPSVAHPSEKENQEGQEVSVLLPCGEILHVRCGLENQFSDLQSKLKVQRPLKPKHYYQIMRDHTPMVDEDIVLNRGHAFTAAVQASIRWQVGDRVVSLCDYEDHDPPLCFGEELEVEVVFADTAKRFAGCYQCKSLRSKTQHYLGPCDIDAPD